MSIQPLLAATCQVVGVSPKGLGFVADTEGPGGLCSQCLSDLDGRHGLKSL